MKIEFRQDINHSHMVILKESAVSAFQEKMVLRNDIAGLLKMKMQFFNGDACYSYDVKGSIPVRERFSDRVMNRAQLRCLLGGIRDIMSVLEKYLLRSSDLIVSPDYVFWSLEKEAPLFAYYPGNTENTQEQWMELAQFIIDSADKKDDESVSLAYSYFEQVCAGIYSPSLVLKKAEGENGRVKGRTRGVEEDEIKGDPFSTPEGLISLDQLWDEEKEESFYSKKIAEQPEEKEDSGALKRALLICGFFTVLAGAVYIFLLSGPQMRGRFAMTEYFYLKAGALTALVFALAMAAALRMGQKWIGYSGKEKEVSDKNGYKEGKEPSEQNDRKKQFIFSGFRKKKDGESQESATEGIAAETFKDIKTAEESDAGDNMTIADGWIQGPEGVSAAGDRNDPERSRKTESEDRIAGEEGGFESLFPAGSGTPAVREEDTGGGAGADDWAGGEPWGGNENETVLLSSPERAGDARNARNNRNTRNNSDVMDNRENGNTVPGLTGIIGGRSIRFKISRNPFLVGKLPEKADALIQDERISRLHACIREVSGEYYLSDLNSTNGTCVNDKRLSGDETVCLSDGDILKFANITMKFVRNAVCSATVTDQAEHMGY